MTLHRIILAQTCTDGAVCSDIILAKLEAGGLKLHAETEGENVDGYLLIHHKQNNHLVVVCIYDQGTHEYVSGEELHDFKETGVSKERPEKEFKGIPKSDANTVSSPPNKGQLVSLLNAPDP